VEPQSSDHPPAAFSIDRAWIHAHPLADGTEVTVRMLRPEDREAFLAGFERLSPESRYFRFFTAMPRLPESVLHQLLHTDGINHVALAAWRSVGGGTTEAIGVARFIRLGSGDDTAEAAIAVVDHMQAHGVGRLLLADLSAAAVERGIRRFRVEVMRGNPAVAALLHDLDANAKPVALEGNVAVYELDVPGVAAEGPGESLVFRMLRLVARGLKVVVGRAIPGTA
jgi:GNAT superfamily N-acetyltransferase